MLISKNWLQDFVDIPSSVTPEQLVFDLTMKTVEVEEVKNLAKDLENIVVGKICSVAKHPNADSLKVCGVCVAHCEKQETCNGCLRVVCGGSNLEVGMLVALGKVGAKVRWHGEGDWVVLEKAKIRGVESSGMICASDELGLEDMFPKKEAKEIMNLSALDVKAGEPMASALGLNDIVFDIDNKSMTHRADLWGHYGMAREISAFYDKKLKTVKPLKIKSGRGIKLSVKIENKKLCPRYMGVAIKGIKIAASPFWMQKRLLSVGVRSINNIVDITNYVMYELGQPMHAFDARQINGESKKEIIVRRAHAGEKFTALDEKEYSLDNEMLVIADSQKMIALAGVIGAADSGIKDDSDSIIFESANFDAVGIRKASVKLGLRTDSSARFEKTLDPDNAEVALRRAVELALEICPGAYVASDVVDESNFKSENKFIKLSLDFVERKLGFVIPKKEIINNLTRLGFEINNKGEDMLVLAPSWRSAKDIVGAEDLVEEIARLYGYDKIPLSLPAMSIAPPARNKLRYVERKLKEALAYEFGFSEVYNYSFVSAEWLKKLGRKVEEYIELDNPVAKDRPLARRDIISGLLQNVENNLHRFESVKIFEIGKIFKLEGAGEQIKFGSQELLPNQSNMLGMAYARKGDDTPFYEISQSILGALNRLGIEAKLKKNKSMAKEPMHESRFAEIYSGGQVFGFIGELHPFAQERLGIPYRTAVLELKADMLVPLLNDVVNYVKLPNYPSVDRDLAFIVGQGVEHSEIVDTIKDADELIKKVELFDTYEGKQIGEGKKGLAYHIVYRSGEKTLEAKEVDKAHDKIIAMLKNKFEIELRK